MNINTNLCNDHTH